MMKLLDKFYTKPEIAQQCFDILRSTINISNEDILLEPSAGSGVFLKCFKNYKYEAYDIEPEGANIEQLDFLTFESEYKDYIVIGNPPFGHRNKLSIDFFNKASSFSKIIGFIIPNTFLKWSVQKQLNKKLTCKNIKEKVKIETIEEHKINQDNEMNQKIKEKRLSIISSEDILARKNQSNTYLF